MRDNYDFSDAIKNPFVGKKEKGKFNVVIKYDFTTELEENESEIKKTVNDSKLGVLAKAL